MGSDEAVIDTPWLSADNLREGYKKAVEAWNSFTSTRMERRKAALVGKLLEALSSGGRRWGLLGERDFASFIWEAGGALVADAFAEGEPRLDDERLVVVVASRHDEEKIYRGLIRGGEPKARIIRLYQ